MSTDDPLTFSVQVTMKARWVPVFLGLLASMERLGNLGGSRWLAFYADGDGDFQPKFSFPGHPPPDCPDWVETEDLGEIQMFDAG